MSSVKELTVNFYIRKFIENENYAQSLLKVVNEIIKPNGYINLNLIFSDRTLISRLKKQEVNDLINELVSNRNNLIDDNDCSCSSCD